MVRTTESWWIGTYPRYTLRNMNSMPVYNTFKSLKNHFSRTEGDRTEAFWEVDHCNIYEWFLQRENKGEKIGFDGWGQTWFYEMWMPEVDHHLTVKTWLKSTAEWGLIIRKYPDREVREQWTVDKGVKTFEQTESVGSKVKTHKEGSKPIAGGMDEWSVDSTESPGEQDTEVNWARPGAKGGETKSQRGSRLSGRAWFESGTDNEEKLWNEDGSRQWGTVKGRKGTQNYEHSWDVDGPNRLESHDYDEGHRNWGSRKKVQGGNWLKEEWEGMRPGAAAGGPAPDYSRQLLTNFEEARNALKESENTLELMMDDAHRTKFEALKTEGGRLPSPAADSPEEVIRAINRVHALLIQHEKLKRSLVQDKPSSAPGVDPAVIEELKARHDESLSDYMDILYSIMLKNDAVSDTLVDALKDGDIKNTLDQFEGEFERIHSEFEETRNPEKVKEMLDLLLRYQPINYEMAGRLHKMDPDQAKKDLAPSGVSMSSQRAKVRSGRPRASAFDQFNEKLDADLDFTAGVYRGLAGDEDSAVKAEEAKQITGDPITTIDAKFTILTELLEGLSKLEISEESTSTEVSQQETTKQETHMIQIASKDAQIAEMTKEMAKREHRIRDMNIELEELRAEHREFKQIKADFDVLQAERDKLQKEVKALRG